MSLPSVDVVRQRIESVADKPVQMCLKTTCITGSRICEIAGIAETGENAYGPKGTDAKEEKFVELLQDHPVIMALAKKLGLKEATEPIPCVVFTIKIAKRKLELGEPIPTRKVALPLNPEYEPWAKEIFSYFQQAGKDLVFPFTRKQPWQYITDHHTFEGLTYTIDRYKDRKRDKNHPTHPKAFKDHALRHLRKDELESFYRFDPIDLAIYHGWSLAMAQRTSLQPIAPMQARYGRMYHDWKRYFPKLLKKRA